MRGSIRQLVAIAVIAVSTPAIADVRPRILDARATGHVTRINVVDGGRAVHISWTDDQNAYGGVIIDATTGRVIRTIGGGQFVETLDEGLSDWRVSTQDSLDVQMQSPDDKGARRLPTPVFDVNTMREVCRLLGDEQILAGVRTNTGPVVLTGGQGILPGSAPASYTLRIWAADASAPRWAFDVPTSDPSATFATAEAFLSSDGRWVAAIREGVLHLIDAATGVARVVSRVAEKPAGSDSADRHIGVGFARDGSLIYVANGAGDIAIMRLPDLSDVRRVSVPDEFQVRHVTEVAGGQVLKLGGRRQTMLLDVSSGQYLRQGRGSSGNSYLLTWLGDGQVLRALRQRQQPIRFGVYAHKVGRFSEAYVKTWSGGSMAAVTWSPNGRCLLMSGGGRTAVLASDTGRQIARLGGAGEGVEAAAFARQGAALFALDQARRILVFEMPARCSTQR